MIGSLRGVVIERNQDSTVVLGEALTVRKLVAALVCLLGCVALFGP